MTLRKSPSRRGFTLVELLVAMAITTMIVGILVTVTSFALDTWNRSRSELRAARQGKAMIETMARDFESLVIRRGNNFEWLYAAYQPTATGPKDSNNKSPNAADLVFFSAATDRYNGDTGSDKLGDVSTVAYQLEYTDPFNSGTSEVETFVLYRELVDPNDTFTTTLGQTYDSASTPLLTAVGTGNIDEQNNFVCENVYQYTITFEVEVINNKGAQVIVPIPIGNGPGAVDTFRISGRKNEISPAPSLPSEVELAQVESGRLAGVQISMTVLTDAGIRQMRNRNFGNADDKDQFIAENSYQYSKRVLVPGT